jgi:hypothetical protein
VSTINDPSPDPETPWEFLPDDDVREELALEVPPPAEAAAMHVETRPPSLDPDLEQSVADRGEAPSEVVHYFADEHPEVPDTSEPQAPTDVTPEVEELLIRQHYLPGDDEASLPDDDTDDPD